MGNRKKKEGSGSFLAQGAILAAAGIIVKLISLLYRVPITNILGDEGQGYYSIAFEIYALALLLTSYSMPLAVSKLVSARVAKGERKNSWRLFQTALLLSVIVGGIAACIFYFGADFIAANILTSPYSAYPLRFLAPGLFVVAILASFRGYFQGLGTMIPTAVSQVLEQVVNAIAAIIGATAFLKIGAGIAKRENVKALKAAYGAAGATLGPVLGAATALMFLLIIFWGYRKTIRRQLLRDGSKKQESYGEIVKILVLTCAPVLLSTAVYNISQSLDAAIFTKIMSVQGVARKEYMEYWGMFSGKYNVWINVPLAMANALGASMIPSMTGAVTTGNKRLIHTKITLVVRSAMLIAIPSFVGLTVMGGPILSLLYSGNVEVPTKMMHIGAISIVFFCLSTVTNAVLQGINKMTVPVRNASISLAIHLVCLVIMMVMFKWGIYSVIVGNIIFSLSMCILNAMSIYEAIGYRQEVRKSFLLPLEAAAIMGVVTFLVYKLLSFVIGSNFATILSLFVAVLVYGISLLKLGGLTETDMRTLPKGPQLIKICRRFHLFR
ncbi:polysaccharide biosynthesis protein [Faecalicatena sp. Marseille-Q4148]|nr:polysaccharide biosynthesis protein [Faecalicatena sp. Marseille-Q4148]